MALDTTSVRAEWAHLVEIALSGSTLTYSDRSLSMSNGIFYDKRILHIPPITRSVGRILDPSHVSPSITIVLDNADDAIRVLADDNAKFAAATITIKVGQGTTIGDYTTVFVGQVQFPNGFRWNTSVVTLRLDERANADACVVPNSSFFPADFPEIEEKSAYQPIPRIYGSWLTTDADGQRVPCYRVEEVSSKVHRFKICEDLIQQIEAVFLLRDGVLTDITSDVTNIRTAFADFRWNVPGGTDDYDETRDTVTANMIGQVHSTLISPIIYSRIPDIAYDILLNVCSVPAGNINVASFIAWHSFLGPDDLGRGWIGKRTNSKTLISQLGNEGFADIIVNDAGNYEAVFRVAGAPASTTTVRSANIKVDPTGKQMFESLGDQERLYLNAVKGPYVKRAQHPIFGPDDFFHREEEDEDTDEQTTVGQTRTRVLKLHWHYIANGAKDRIARELLAFGAQVELIELTLDPVLIGKKPTDPFQLIFSVYEILSTLGTPFQIRQIEPDYENMVVKVLAWNQDSLQAKRYQADGSPVYTSATAYAQLVDGFFADSNSEADPGDPDSAGQVYF